jgi:hypothetical protein
MPSQIWEEALVMTKKTTRTRAEAKRLMWTYYRDNKEYLPKWIRECRENILTDIQEGLSPEVVFGRILEDVHCDTVPMRQALENRFARAS